MKCTTAIIASLTVGSTALGDLFFYDISQDGWDPFLNDVASFAYTQETQTGWNALPDWGITSIDGPVNTNTNNAIFSPGDIPYNLAFDSNLSPWGTPGPAGRGVGGAGLVGVGPSGGWGNPSNALLANYFVDGFDIFATESNVRAMAFNALTLVGGNAVDITVFGPAEQVLGSRSGPAPPGGAWYGILATPDQPNIHRVNLYDVELGAEGVMEVITYIPAPGALALLGLAGVVGTLRRRI
jgi:hypothetical protein